MTAKPSLFWVEADVLQGLLERVGAKSAGSVPRRSVAAQPAEAQPAEVHTTEVHTTEVHTTEVQTAGTQPTPQPATPKLAVPKKMEALAMAAESALAPPVLPPFQVPIGPLEERLGALLDWIHSAVSYLHAFVVDQDGLALVGEDSAPLELIAASASLSDAWDSLRSRFDLATESFVSAALTDRRRLHLLTTETGWGKLSLGLVLKGPVRERTLLAIGEKFRQTLEEPKEHDRT